MNHLIRLLPFLNKLLQRRLATALAYGIGVVFVFYGTTATAQDIHYSQVTMNPQFQSPALTGVFQGDWRVGAQYRGQWETVPAQFRTATGFFEKKIIRRNSGAMSAGLQLTQDQAGDATLSWTQAGINMSYAQAITPGQSVSIGFGGGMVQRKVDISNLTFQNQWDGDVYNPRLSPKEILNNTTGSKLSVSTGVNWHFERGGSARTRADVGVSAQHLNRPEIHFKGDQPYALPVRYHLYAQGMLQGSEQIDYVFLTHFQKIGTASSVLTGTGIRYWISEASAVQFNLAVRWGDAVIPAVQLYFNQWTVAMSYDVNISKFKVATQRRGGLELSAIYTATPVQPIKDLKACPIF